MPAPVPAVDYTNKDYASLRQAMLDLARYRLPEWTDQTPADLGVLMIDLFAYMGDIVLYYQDRIASESFLTTAAERRSVLLLLRLIGYELQAPIASNAELSLTFNAPGNGASSSVTIPQGAQFATDSSAGPVQTFEYLGPDMTVDVNTAPIAGAGGIRTLTGLQVRNSKTAPQETLGSSTGEPNQSFPLSQQPLIADSLEVEVDEGAGFVLWDRRDNLLYYTASDGSTTVAGAGSTDYYVQYDENGVASVVFGDGIYGKVPAPGNNNIRARYRTGGGAAGNVAANAISKANTKLALFKSVANPAAAVGGADGETLDHAVRFGPLAFRSGMRAVTLNDYVSLAQQAGGVAKVRARSRGWNQVDLFVAPQGTACAAATADLKKRLVAFFEDKRMAGTFVHVQDPTCVPVDIAAGVVVQHNYDPETVRQGAIAAIRNLLAFANVDFAITLYLSQIYEAVESVPGVFAVNVTQFMRRSLLPLVPLRFGIQIPQDGRIRMDDFEIPMLGALNVTAEEVVT